jgi:DUF971 family protein
MNHAGATDPADIAVSRERREVRIRWTDGHESAYPFDLLRKECPCAHCNELRSKVAGSGGLGLQVLTGPVLRAGEVQATSVSPVGRYALGFVWSDGHDSGIYSYEFLRALCPCAACRDAAAGSEGKHP